ncbi:glycosyltransferase family 2 protein [Algoriphagus machipongonensis]|uniref:Group 2 family glycosyl transferase n=1 Tax=Algoriphagus machipongonensis TaxID=388413 RepID=A3HRI6_9BACT|nr:glycosyltransferase [Algoriphagus machipongonensis]EAZ82454.1 group 2 family glycosyl transferase [Algoriphagus machipongonensis]
MESILIRISIIIPTLERPKELLRILKELEVSKNDQVEIIVVDDSVVSQNEELAITYSDLIYIHRGEKLGVSSARNVGAEVAKGQYLIFFDDDDSFTDLWLGRFLNSIKEKPDLVFCNFLSINPSGKETIVFAKNEKWRAVIPGTWMVRKDIFFKIGGFDSRLKFAENTELFFRLNQLDLKICYIDQVNFIYKQSVDGGSKNMQNMLDSIALILQKHENYLTDHVKHLYHQNIGVIQMRFKKFKESRRNLALAIKYKPSKIGTYFRFGIACFPILAKKIYTQEISPK